MGHDHLGDAGDAQMVDPGLDRAVQAPARLPHHQRAALSGPLGDVVVVAHHGDR